MFSVDVRCSHTPILIIFVQGVVTPTFLAIKH